MHRILKTLNMVQQDYFKELPEAVQDEMNNLTILIDSDKLPNKIDGSIGVLQNSNCEAHLPKCVKEAKEIMSQSIPNHNYILTTGLPEFLEFARSVVFGEVAEKDKIVSVQTVAGTGACHLAFEFLTKLNVPNFYVGVPGWANYIPMITSSSGKLPILFNHYNKQTHKIDMESLRQAMKNAEKRSAFVLQAVCHNPTGTDYTEDMWDEIAFLAMENDLIIVLDTAYLGYSSGNFETDSYAIRKFFDEGLQFLVCQSFSKNLCLYSERIGALHVVTKSSLRTSTTKECLRAIIRSEMSCPPAYGVRLASIIGGMPHLKNIWKAELREMSQDVINKRQMIYNLLIEASAPGDFSHLLTQRGLFWFSGLSKDQCNKLVKEHNIYIPTNGRINITGINQNNIKHFVESLLKVLAENCS